MTEHKYKVIFVLGLPGAGKGTQCQEIEKHCGYRHISAGELIRQELKKDNSDLKPVLEESLRVGPLIPSHLMAIMLLNAMTEQPATHLAIDGFPRNMDNLQAWVEIVGDQAVVQKVIHLDCPQQVCLKRCMSRGPGGSGRTDDTQDNLSKRFNHFREETKTVLDHFKSKACLVDIDGDRSQDEVFQDVAKVLESVY